MKSILCLLIALLTLCFPASTALKKYCDKLADSTYVISEKNKENCKSVAVQILSEK